MNRDSGRQSAIILAVIGILPVVWLGLLIAPSVKGGLPEILPSLLTVFNDPFHIELCGDSLTIPYEGSVLLLFYLLFLVLLSNMYCSSTQGKRYGISRLLASFLEICYHKMKLSKRGGVGAFYSFTKRV